MFLQLPEQEPEQVCVQYSLQLPEHVPLQVDWQAFLQLPEHVPEQVLEHPYLHPIGFSSEAWRIAGALASATAARIGSAPLAALLKNSRRDWSSPFFFLSIIKTIKK